MSEQLQPDLKHTAPGRVKRKRSRGQSIVEFALILPLLLGFLLIAGDFGRALTAYMTVSSAASEGASFASTSGDVSLSNEVIATAARNEVGPDGTIWGEEISVDVTRDDDLQGYPFVEVTVSYEFEPMFSVWPIPGEIEMDRTVRMRVLGS